MAGGLSKAGWLGFAKPLPRPLAILLAALPFILLLVAYLYFSDARLEANPADKLMPSFQKMGATLMRYALEEDPRTGARLLATDWLASMKRMGMGLGLSALAGLIIGVATGLFPYLRAFFMPFVTFWSIVPPLAILPILFIVFGVGEGGKIAILFLGTVWFIARDIHDYVRAIPNEQIVKALSFNASLCGLLRRIILPQVMPRLIDAVRMSLGAAWLFLIAAEAIASTDGLGYRIFLVRRYLAMDVIIPYVGVITLTGFMLDIALRRWVAWRHEWYEARRR